jgi:ABC-type glutathione transport system ATPase component
MTLLEIRDLTVGVVTDDTERALVRELSLDLEQGRTLCVVGESGSGKTVTALSPRSAPAGRSRSTASTSRSCPPTKCAPTGARGSA